MNATRLPTRAAMFANARDALDRAYSELSSARDWLLSDWTPIGAELTSEAAAARRSIIEAIGDAKNRIATAKADAAAAIESFR